MWSKLATIILRNRAAVLIAIVAITIFMGYNAMQVKMTYKFAGLLPQTDTSYIEYQNFIEEFSEDGNVIALGLNDSKIRELEVFNKWYDLGDELRKIQVPLDSIVNGVPTKVEVSAIDSVFSIARTYSLSINEAEKRFDFGPILTKKPETQEQVDAHFATIKSLPFYDRILYKSENDATIMMVFVNAELFNSEKRGPSVERLLDQVYAFEDETGVDIHVSGLPYIRTEITKKVKKELQFFIILAAVITGFLLFLFFNNWRVVMISMLVVGIGVVWSLGTISLFGFEISALMGLIPPLMIVIGVPNCIYLINKYHSEYKRHGKKALALTRVVEKIGVATFMTNATTSLGFATFIFTHSDLLKEFGIIASINVMAVFFISILIIPVLLSYLAEPRHKHLKHLDRKWVYGWVNKLVKVIQINRAPTYIVTAIILILSFIGISKMTTTGNIVSDLPSNDKVITDLKWFESEIGGVMPFEIIVAGKANQFSNGKNDKRIEKLQKLIHEYPYFSKSLSIADASKFVRQAYHKGNPKKYTLPLTQEKIEIKKYFEHNYASGGIEHTFLNEDRSKTRITAQIADIGTTEMADFMAHFQPRLDSIFDPQKFDVVITGTSVVFLKGSAYMVNNLLISLMIAIGVIALIMAFLFKSVRMVLISLLPNLLPLLFTAGVMGFFGIPLKPSTILVFSIAFGISVDDTIHFLAKYRQELKRNHWNIKSSVLLAVKETGISMMYTSVVLFFGFGIFGASEFDGTRALGILVSVTLLIAMFANLVLLPSLLLSLDKRVTTKAFSEPYLELIDEEDDIVIDDLRVRPNPSFVDDNL